MSQAVTDARGDVQEIEFLGIAVRVHDLGDGEICEFTAPAGPIAPPHRHAWPETHYVIEGEIEHTVGDTVHRVGPGDYLTIAGDTVHPSNAVTPVRWLEFTGTAKPSRFFAQISREANDPPVDLAAMQKLAAIAAQHDVELLLG